MGTVKEFCEKLMQVIEEHPEVSNFEVVVKAGNSYIEKVSCIHAHPHNSFLLITSQEGLADLAVKIFEDSCKNLLEEETEKTSIH